jgi:hypothetical protein
MRVGDRHEREDTIRAGFNLCFNCMGSTPPSARRRRGLGAVNLESNDMNPIKLVAIALIVAGTLGLIYGGFSYTRNTTVVKIGPVELSAKEKKTVNIPLWAGVAAIGVGGLLLVFGSKRK